MKWLNDAVPWAFIGGASLLGRLMFHAKMVQIGKRKALSWALAWDLPIALASGWSAYGMAVFFHVPWEAQVSAAIVSSYFGPYAMDTVFDKYLTWKFGKATVVRDGVDVSE